MTDDPKKKAYEVAVEIGRQNAIYYTYILEVMEQTPEYKFCKKHLHKHELLSWVMKGFTESFSILELSEEDRAFAQAMINGEIVYGETKH